jgi:hypothetical protein
VSLIGAIQQLRGYPDPGQDRYTTLEYYGEVETGENKDFQDVSAPLISGRGLASVEIPSAAIHGDRASFSVHAAPGTLIATNIGAGPNLVHITGAKAVGVDAQTGNMVLQVGSRHRAVAARAGDLQASSAPVSGTAISISTGAGLPIVLGRVLTLAALAILALELLLAPAARSLGRRARAPRVSQQHR